MRRRWRWSLLVKIEGDPLNTQHAQHRPVQATEERIPLDFTSTYHHHHLLLRACACFVLSGSPSIITSKDNLLLRPVRTEGRRFTRDRLYKGGVRDQCLLSLRSGRSPRGYSLSYVNSGITVADIAASSTAESRSAGSRRHCTVWEVHRTLTGVDRVIRVNTTAQL